MNLRARKQQRARDEIVAAAWVLFRDRAYAEVTVADIADIAQVGRTTFFRYFGDKQEVVFADEDTWLADADRAFRARVASEPSLATALSALRRTVADLCGSATRDPGRYVLRERLMAENPELGDRLARKQRRLMELLAGALRGVGAAAEVAELAPRIALACYHAGHELAGGDPAALGPAVAAAFDRLGIDPPRDGTQAE